jgi:hypothetical protein
LAGFHCAQAQNFGVPATTCMPHPRRITAPVKIPRFSQLVPSEVPALQSPLANENHGDDNKLLDAPAEKHSFNPWAAKTTAALLAVLLGGLFIGVQSKEFMQSHEVVHHCTSRANFRNGVSTRGCQHRQRLPSTPAWTTETNA